MHFKNPLCDWRRGCGASSVVLVDADAADVGVSCSCSVVAAVVVAVVVAVAVISISDRNNLSNDSESLFSAVLKSIIADIIFVMMPFLLRVRK